MAAPPPNMKRTSAFFPSKGSSLEARRSPLVTKASCLRSTLLRVRPFHTMPVSS